MFMTVCSIFVVPVVCQSNLFMCFCRCSELQHLPDDDHELELENYIGWLSEACLKIAEGRPLSPRFHERLQKLMDNLSQSLDDSDEQPLQNCGRSLETSVGRQSDSKPSIPSLLDLDLRKGHQHKGNEIIDNSTKTRPVVEVVGDRRVPQMAGENVELLHSNCLRDDLTKPEGGRDVLPTHHVEGQPRLPSNSQISFTEQLMEVFVASGCSRESARNLITTAQSMCQAEDQLPNNLLQGELMATSLVTKFRDVEAAATNVEQLFRVNDNTEFRGSVVNSIGAMGPRHGFISSSRGDLMDRTNQCADHTYRPMIEKHPGYIGKPEQKSSAEHSVSNRVGAGAESTAQEQWIPHATGAPSLSLSGRWDLNSRQNISFNRSNATVGGPIILAIGSDRMPEADERLVKAGSNNGVVGGNQFMQPSEAIQMEVSPFVVCRGSQPWEENASRMDSTNVSNRGAQSDHSRRSCSLDREHLARSVPLTASEILAKKIHDELQLCDVLVKIQSELAGIYDLTADDSASPSDKESNDIFLPENLSMSFMGKNVAFPSVSSSISGGSKDKKTSRISLLDSIVSAHSASPDAEVRSSRDSLTNVAEQPTTSGHVKHHSSYAKESSTISSNQPFVLPVLLSSHSPKTVPSGQGAKIAGRSALPDLKTKPASKTMTSPHTPVVTMLNETLNQPYSPSQNSDFGSPVSQISGHISSFGSVNSAKVGQGISSRSMAEETGKKAQSCETSSTSAKKDNVSQNVCLCVFV